VARPVLYQCGGCGEMVTASTDFVNALNPATCAICLRGTWLVRPEIGDPVTSVPASNEAEEWAALLSVEGLDAMKMVREAQAEAKTPKPEWN